MPCARTSALPCARTGASSRLRCTQMRELSLRGLAPCYKTFGHARSCCMAFGHAQFRLFATVACNPQVAWCFPTHGFPRVGGLANTRSVHAAVLVVQAPASRRGNQPVRVVACIAPVVFRDAGEAGVQVSDAHLLERFTAICVHEPPAPLRDRAFYPCPYAGMLRAV